MLSLKQVETLNNATSWSINWFSAQNIQSTQQGRNKLRSKEVQIDINNDEKCFRNFLDENEEKTALKMELIVRILIENTKKHEI